MRHPVNQESESYSFRPELDTAKRALTTEDREAEIQLDLIRQLVDRRQGRSALQLLSDLQPKIDSGALSAPVRARFYINKGVCHLFAVSRKRLWRSLSAPRVLDPKNPKALINLAQVALLRKEFTKALELASRARIDRKRRKRLLGATGLSPSAWRKTDLDSLLSSNSWLLDEQACLYTVAFIAFDEDSFEEGRALLRRHNEKDSKYAEAWSLLGSSILVPAQRQIRERALPPT